MPDHAMTPGAYRAVMDFGPVRDAYSAPAARYIEAIGDERAQPAQHRSSPGTRRSTCLRRPSTARSPGSTGSWPPVECSSSAVFDSDDGVAAFDHAVVR